MHACRAGAGLAWKMQEPARALLERHLLQTSRAERSPSRCPVSLCLQCGHLHCPMLPCSCAKLLRCLPAQFPMPELQQRGYTTGAEQPQVTVGIGMLRARDQMGVAHVACAEGCTCEPKSIDLHSNKEVGCCPRNTVSTACQMYLDACLLRREQVSLLERGAKVSVLSKPGCDELGCMLVLQRALLYLHYLQVSWAPECSMLVTVSEQTSSGEHRVAVASLVVSEDVADTQHTYSTADAAVGTDAHGFMGRKLMLSAS